MDKNWDRVLQWTLQEEGSELRRDRGWPAKFGVDLERLRRARLPLGLSTRSVEELEQEDAARILKREWEQLGLASYPSGLDYFVFDCSLFCGRGVSIGWLGNALCRSDIHGLGDEDVALEVVKGLEAGQSVLLIEKMGFMRRRRHKSLPGWSTLMPVWTNRVTRVQRRAKQLTASDFVVQLEQVAVHHAG